MTWGNIAAVAPGAIQTPAMPASGVPVANQTGGTVSVYLTTGAASPITVVSLGGTLVTGLTVAWTGINPPTWQWLP